MERDKTTFSRLVEMPDSARASLESPLYSPSHTLLPSHDEPQEIINPIADLYSANTNNTSRLTRIRQTISKKGIKTLLYEWRWVIAMIGLFFFMGLLMVKYRREVFQGLETLSSKLKDMGYSGYILMASLIFLSAFPPILGYGTYQTLSGYTFGFNIGFPISYFSALAGAVACFYLTRLCFKKSVTRMLSRYSNLEAVVKAVEKKGFKLFVLIRVSPYPFNLLNVFFAATEIHLLHFAAGTALSLLKIALHVYIGANLTSFAKHILGEDEDLTESQKKAENVRVIATVLGSIVAFAATAYLYRVAKVAVLEASLEDEEQETFLAGHSGDEEEEAQGYLDHHELDILRHDEEEEEEDQVLFNVMAKKNTMNDSISNPLEIKSNINYNDQESEPRESIDAWDAWNDDGEIEEDKFQDEQNLINSSELLKKSSSKSD